jgi:hypothetical protein
MEVDAKTVFGTFKVKQNLEGAVKTFTNFNFWINALGLQLITLVEGLLTLKIYQSSNNGEAADA